VLRGCLVVVALALSVATVAAASTPATRLAIAVYPKGGDLAPVHRYTLSCNPAAGTVPRPVRACRALARMTDPFAPVAPRTVCAQLTLGPQEAVVTGVLRGRRVRTRLNLRGSCEIARWRRVTLVVPGFPPGQ
jgi:hypothetical protein